MRKITAGLGTAALVAVAALAPAGAASAHEADITGTSVCQDDGTQLVTVAVTTSNVPSDALGEVKVITPINVWLFEWPEHAANHGLPPLPANTGFTYDLTVVGDAKSVATTVQIDWSDGYSHDPGTTIDLPGDCTPPVEEPPTETPTPTPTPSEPTPPVETPEPTPTPSEPTTPDEPVTPPTVPSEPVIPTEPTTPVQPQPRDEYEAEGDELAVTG